jgi:hypothetical protein
MLSVGMDGKVRKWARGDNTLSGEIREQVSAVMYFQSKRNMVAFTLRIEGGTYLVEILDVSSIT